MYSFRKLPPTLQKQTVDERVANGNPPHQPPHHIRTASIYLMTVACYKHQSIINTPARRDALLKALFNEVEKSCLTIHAWAVLSNHYHLIIEAPFFAEVSNLFRLVHGRLSYQWNQEENRRGRKVWYRYSDRVIRNERHFFTTLNYVHYNAVKHGFVDSPYNWEWSSVHRFRAQFGRDWLRGCWEEYPVHEYGRGWDD